MHRPVPILSFTFHVALCVAAIYAALAAPDPRAGGAVVTALRVAAEPERSLASPIRVTLVALLLLGLTLYTRASRHPWR